MSGFCEEAEAAVEAEVRGEEGEGDAGAEGQHAGVCCGGGAGEEVAGVEGEGTDEGEENGVGGIEVAGLRLVSFQEGESDEGEAAGADGDAGGAAEGLEAVGCGGGERGVQD